jgi:hypothetical protein
VNSTVLSSQLIKSNKLQRGNTFVQLVSKTKLRFPRTSWIEAHLYFVYGMKCVLCGLNKVEEKGKFKGRRAIFERGSVLWKKQQ